MAATVYAVSEDQPATDNLGDLTPLCGCICVTIFSNLYVPACFGCGAEGELLCMNVDMDFCRVITPRANQHLLKDEGTCCVCVKGDWTFTMKPSKCISMKWSLCCAECRSALPTTKDYPCMLNVLGITCCVAGQMKCGFMQTMKMLQAESSGGGAPASLVDDIDLAPTTESMDRECTQEEEAQG